MERTLGVDGFEVGGYHSEEARSGITVVFPPEGSIAGISQWGGSPGTRETDLLRPFHRNPAFVDAVALCGRSVFGFRAVEGVVERLRVDGKGYRVGGVNVPIVPAAVIFDFHGDQSDEILPTMDWGYRAYDSRLTKLPIGSKWAGRGATVGKSMGRRWATQSGQGYSWYERGKLKIGVLTVVNAVGDVYNKSGQLVAGPRRGRGRRIGVESVLRHGFRAHSHLGNTTIGVVITNLKADTCDLCMLAHAANLGYASVIKPYNTAYDGDTVFAVTSNEVRGDIEVAKVIAREQAADSVLSVFTT